MYGFLLPAERANLDRFFAAKFNEPSGGAVLTTAAAPFVLLYVSKIPAIRLRDDVGWYSERESGIMAFGVDVRTRHLFTTLDYLFVDSGQAMANGREVFGFPKHIGRFPVDEWLDDPLRPSPTRCPDPINLETLGVERFGTDAWAADQELWRLERSDDVAPRAMTDPVALFDLASRALASASIPNLVGSILRPFADVDGRPAPLGIPYRAPLDRGGRVVLDTHPDEPAVPLAQARMPFPLLGLGALAYDLLEQVAQNRLTTLLHKQVRSAVHPGTGRLFVDPPAVGLQSPPVDGCPPRRVHAARQPDGQRALGETFGWDRPVTSLLSFYTEYDFTYDHDETVWSSMASIHE